MNELAIPILTARAQRINTAHRNALAAGRSMLAYTIEAGQELLEVKAGLKHGEFMPWCEANLTAKYDTVAQYMRAAKAAAGKPVDLHNFEGGLRTFLDAHAERHSSAVSHAGDS